MSAIVTLKKGEGRTIKAGGMWVFDNEIDTVTGTFENGEVVLVHDFDGYPMGRGFINVNSKIHVRMLTRKIDQEIDRAFLQMRVQNAWDYRKKTVDTSSCRVIFGEADFLPGLVVDKYEDVLVVECLALGMEQFKETILVYAELANPQSRLVPESTVVVTLYRQTDSLVPAVPPSAVQHDAQGAFVYVVQEDDRVSLRRVTLGNLVGESQTVRSGLTAHERVVTDGTHKVADGMKVDYARKGADAGVQD